MRRRLFLLAAAAVLAVVAGVWLVAYRRHGPLGPQAEAQRTGRPAGPITAESLSGIRLSGTVEAVRASTVIVPRLAGQTANALVITHLVTAGTSVAPGDLLVEFDPQEQLRNAIDRRADVVDLNGQIQKKRADQAIARAVDETAVAQTETDLERAQLDLAKNEFVTSVEAEKNTLAVEQTTAKLTQLRNALVLKQKAAEADLKILQIRSDRAERALHYAESNATLMAVHATFAGVAVVKSVWKGNTMGEVVEGDEVRPGQPILDIIDPTAMQVRARVNQADIGLVAQGQAATIRLDAYPELTFDGRVELVAPLGVTSSLTRTVHTFTALVSIHGTHPRLMPDLTASVDIGASTQPPPSLVASRGSR